MTLIETAKLLGKIDSLWPGRLPDHKMSKTIQDWNEYLAGATFEDALKALEAYADKGIAYFPTASEIKELIIKEKAKEYPSAEDFIARTRRAVLEFGAHDAAGAIAYLGDEMWGAVMAVAPWQRICMAMDEIKLKTAWEYHVRQTIKKEMEKKHG